VKHLGADRQTASKVFPGYPMDAAKYRGVLR
jgi:hypothetical protein